MLLVIDAGNTNIVFAIFEGQKLVGHWRIATDARRTADEYAVWLNQLLQLKGIDPKHIRHAIAATVVPRALFDLRMLCRNYFQTELMVVGDPGVDAGMEVAIESPAELGADRLVNAVAAREAYGNGLIIIDFGTATTFDVVDGKGRFAGGIIAPGIALSLEALHAAAAKLPNVAIQRPAKVVGTNTITAMQSGIYFGYLGLIEGIVERIRKERKTPMKTIATGGLAKLFARGTPAIDQLDSDLTIHGLRIIFERNQNRQQHAA
jgi:type III pantothenate kinase